LDPPLLLSSDLDPFLKDGSDWGPNWPRYRTELTRSVTLVLWTDLRSICLDQRTDLDVYMAYKRHYLRFRNSKRSIAPRTTTTGRLSRLLWCLLAASPTLRNKCGAHWHPTRSRHFCTIWALSKS